MQKPITIERIVTKTDEIGNQIETFEPIISCFAEVNCQSGKEYISAGAERTERIFTFKVRYCKAVSKITALNCRIVYDGEIYDVKHVDYFESNEFLKILGVAKND